MPKANLNLLGASLSLSADRVKAVLAAECQLPESDIDAACAALFEQKKTFVLFKDVELAVAANHFGRLKPLGIDCEVEVLNIGDSDDASNSNVLRTRALAAVCVLSVAVGGYFFYNHKTNQVVANQTVQLPKTEKVAVNAEFTEFHHWRNRLDEIENLKQALDQVTTNRQQAELIASTEDLFVRTVSENYVTQQAIQRLDQSSKASSVLAHRQTLEASLAAINNQPASLDRFYVTLDLAGVYQQLQYQHAAQSAFELAENMIEGLNQTSDIVIAEVALAEYQHLYGQKEYRDTHFTAAAAAAISGYDATSGNLQEWAIAYIARCEAKLGLFAQAHRSLRTISNEQITDSAMVDISRYAASNNNEPEFEILEITGETSL